MTQYLLIENDVVIGVSEDPAGFGRRSRDAIAYDGSQVTNGAVMNADGTFTLAPPTKRKIDQERERRIAETFKFNGAAYQLDRDSQAHIDSAGAAAKFAIISGAQPGDLRWHGGPSDFEWIATDNTKVPMDAQTMSAFADAALLWVISHRIAARSIKDNPRIPDDYDQDRHWPRTTVSVRKR